MATLQFNAATVEPSAPMEAIPAGTYPVMIVNSEMKPTKDGQGQYLELHLKIVDGPYINRMVFDRLNLVNRNATAVEIAQRTLSAICHAVGVLQVQDSQQLHNRPMLAKVAYVPANDRYGEKNEVKGYKAMQGGQQGQAPAAPAQGQAAPWQRQQPAPAQPAPMPQQQAAPAAAPWQR